MNMQNNPKTDRTLNRNNHLMLQYLTQVEKAVVVLNEMGLTVINVHFERIRPTIRVMQNAITERLEREGNATVFHVGGNGVMRYHEAQITCEGIRVIWRKFVN